MLGFRRKRTNLHKKYDYPVFDSPDEFYARHGSNLSGLKRWLYSHVIRHRMNAQVRRIRAEKW